MEIMHNDELAKKPYKTIELKYETEEDYNKFKKILELNKLRKPILVDEQVIGNIFLHRYIIHNGNKTKFRYFCTYGEDKVDNRDFKLSDIKAISRIKIKIEKIDNTAHAQWKISKFADDYYSCTGCGSVWNRAFDFCPSCGAKMDNA